MFESSPQKNNSVITPNSVPHLNPTPTKNNNDVLNSTDESIKLLHKIHCGSKRIIHKARRITDFSNNVNYNFFKRMLKEGWFFIFASFFSAFTPICICLISAAIPFRGGEVVMGIGLLTSFQIIFCNVGFAMAMAMIFAIIKLTQNRSKDNGFVNEVGLVVSQILINLVIGILMTIVSVGISIGYTAFNCGRPNMELVKVQSWDYIWITVPVIVLNSWLSVLVLVIFKNKGNLAAFLVLFAQNAIAILCMALFAFCSDLLATGIAIGYNLSLVFGIILAIIVIMTGSNRYKFRELKMRWSDYVFLMKSTYKVGIVSAWRISVRGLIVIILSIISTRITHIVPLNLVYAKVLWFNMNFFLPWFATGIANTLKYSTVKNPQSYDFKDVKPFIYFITITVFLNLLTSAIWFSCLPNIIDLYISNLESMQVFAVNHLYLPAGGVAGQTWDQFEYGWNLWGNPSSAINADGGLPIPSWIKDQNGQLTLPDWFPNSTKEYFANYLNSYNSWASQAAPDQITNQYYGLGQLYWVNTTTWGSYTNGESSIMNMFWGWDAWNGTPGKFAPFFCTTILFIILYHGVMTMDTFFTQITSLYTKKSRSFLTSLFLHTAIMTFVLVFGYFEAPTMGIEAFVLPFFGFTLVMCIRSMYIFTKVSNQYRVKYYSEHLDVTPSVWFVKWQQYKQTRFVKAWRKFISPFMKVQQFTFNWSKKIINAVLSWKWVLKLFNLTPQQVKTKITKVTANIGLDTKLLINKVKPNINYVGVVNNKDDTMNENDKVKYNIVEKIRNEFNDYYNLLSPHDDHAHRHKWHKITPVANNLRKVICEAPLVYPADVTPFPADLVSVNQYDDTMNNVDWQVAKEVFDTYSLVQKEAGLSNTSKAA